MGGGRERSEQGTKTAGWLDDREGDLGKQAAAADKEDERAGQDEGWATLLLSCLLLIEIFQPIFKVSQLSRNLVKIVQWVP